MPLSAKFIVGGVTVAVLTGAIYLVGTRGAAMLLDMAAGAAAFICL